MISIVSFVGRHNAGKTTLLVNIIEKLSQKGIKVAVIKHASHVLDIGTEHDSDRLFNAGASTVYASSPETTIIYRRHKEQGLEEIIAEISEVDLLITEGYKKESHPKIEVLRKEIDTGIMKIDNVIARVADFAINDSLPSFDFKQIEEISDFIIHTFALS